MTADEGMWNMTHSSSSLSYFETVTKWTVLEVADWLKGKGHHQSIWNSCIQQKIDGKGILLLTENDLKEILPPMLTLGEVKRLYFDLLHLQQQCSPVFTSRPDLSCQPFLYAAAPPKLNSTSPVVSGCDQESTAPCFAHGHAANSNSPLCYNRKRTQRRVSFQDSDSSQNSDNDEIRSSAGELPKPKPPPTEGHRDRRLVLGGYATNLKPEIGKVIVALGYVFVVTWVTSLTMVVVHDRVPSMEKFPPLPDLFLDNIPQIPYAFEMCEVTGTILFCLFLGVLFFHKHRFILIRRFFALSGTVFLLRCVTMLITSLSVPGQHLLCKPRPYESWFQRFYSAYLIWKGAGMSIQGVRTCGDYMFSGHTVALTMLNFFVTEYTTRRMYYLHTLSWLLNMFGIFFILAAHEHYSIDVFIAFYITSRLFLYYHTLANNQALMQRDSKRTKIWFPLFSYFESQVDGIVPNQYDWPITTTRLKNWTILTLGTLEMKWKDLIPNPNEGFLRTKFFLKPTTLKKDD